MKKTKLAVDDSASMAAMTSMVAVRGWPSLTGLRGLAALWVLLLHSYNLAGRPDDVVAPLAWLLQMGWTGVDVFFTLSAFLLSLPFAEANRNERPRPNTTQYFKRRLARVLPAYYLQCLLLGLLVAGGFAKVVFWYAPTWQAWLAHLFLWINLWPLVPAFVPVWWTLPVELGFYLVLPVLARCLTDRRWFFLLLLIGLSLLFRYGVLSSSATMQQQIFWADCLPGRLFQFLIGMLAAYFWVKWRTQIMQISKTSRNLLLFLSCAILLALPGLGGWGNAAYAGAPTLNGPAAFYHLFASVVIAIILLMLVSGNTAPSGVFSSWPLQWLGKISYGLYLWHYPVMLLLRENMGGIQVVREDFPGFFIASFLISITLAFLSWHWLEAPILRRVGSAA